MQKIGELDHYKLEILVKNSHTFVVRDTKVDDDALIWYFNTDYSMVHTEQTKAIPVDKIQNIDIYYIMLQYINKEKLRALLQS